MAKVSFTDSGKNKPLLFGEWLCKNGHKKDGIHFSVSVLPIDMLDFSVHSRALCRLVFGKDFLPQHFQKAAEYDG